MIKPRYIVSACLAGENCRYDGQNNYDERIETLVKEGLAVLVCPEVMGGLHTPRIPCERYGNRVINKNGEDKTIEFQEGADISLDIALRKNIKRAILKERSPSCGVKFIHDGTFSNHLISGRGVLTELLEDNGFLVYSEEDEPFYDAIIVAAGSGSRTGLEYNKMFYHSGVVTVIEKAAEPFIADYLCSKVIIVCKKEEQPMFEAFLPYSKVVYAYGGESREESVYNGLKMSTSEYVLIHDGARANLTLELVNKIVKEAQKKKTSVVPFVDVLDHKRDYIVDNRAIQTPQAHHRETLKQAMEEIKENLKEYRDESGIISAHTDVPIHYIKGELNNFKITEKEDLAEWAAMHTKEDEEDD